MSAAPRILNSALRLSARSTKPVSGYVARRGNATAVTPPPSADASETINAVGKPSWTREEVQKVYDTPLMELIFRAVSAAPWMG